MNLKEIKDAARQAFRDQQSQDTEGGVPDGISFIAGFLAGVKHRQDEIDELEKKINEREQLLKKVAFYMSGQILNEGQYVKQLDGSVEWELIPTLAGRIYEELKKYR